MSDFAFSVQIPSSGNYTVQRPFINRLQDKRLLTDYISRDQWAGIRSGSPIGKMTNDFGQDSFLAALADLSSLGGCIEVPEGSFAANTYVITGHDNLWIRGSGNSTNWITNTPTGHLMDFRGLAGSISDLRFMADPLAGRSPEMGNACIHLGWQASRFWCERVEAINHGTFLQLDGQNPDNPNENLMFCEINSPRVFGAIAGSHVMIINGGYAVRINDPRLTVDSLDPSEFAATGILVLSTADLSIDGVTQILGFDRPIDVRPPVGSVVASFRMKDGFLGTSNKGSRFTAADGGTIVSASMNGVWCGQNKDATSPGALTLVGYRPGGIQQMLLTNMEFPECASDGLNADEYVRGLSVMGGWADGCPSGAGISIRSQGFRVMGFRSGGDRFAPNAYGAWLGAGCDDFIFALNDLRGNGTNFINGAGTGPSKVIYGNLGT
ncbi:hypothetical protein DFO45_2696 [Azorhizobium sp. AG788]|uniref:hypothetical protein n=1 Tax=Azorhizobium sp. AG788 TaxID=2183897 RepID=UPI0010609704|nr:hypothetical protein [Azorhizobium sp. AG788]TDT94938.1 hypothetical protein DFO45_2696 [Azorhizobium sp. AG788]